MAEAKHQSKAVEPQQGNPDNFETLHGRTPWNQNHVQQQEHLPHLLRQKRQQFLFDMVNEVGRYITSILDLDTLLWEVTRYTREVFNAYGTAVGLIEGGEVVLRIGVGENGRHDVVRTPVGGQSMAARVVTQGIGEIVADVHEQADHLPIESLAKARSGMAVPVKHNEQIIGVLLAFSEEVNAFDPAYLRLMEMLAEHVAVAIVNARLIAKQRVETWGSAVLLRVARILSGIRSQEDIIYAILGLALDLTGAEYGALLTFNAFIDESRQQRIFTSNDTINAALQELGPAWQERLLQALHNQEQLQISYAHYAPPELEPLMHALSIEVAMLAPIRIEDQTWGVLILGYASAHRFTRYDFNLIAGLAAQAAAAIDNAWLLKQVQDKRSYLEAVIANTGEGLFLVDPEGHVTYCNPRLEELIGVKYSDMRDVPYTRLFEEIAALSERSQETAHQLAAALDNLNQQPTVHLVTNYPLVYHLQIGLFPILDEGMHAIGWGGIVRDVTAEWDEITKRTEHLSNLTHEMRTSLATMKGLITTLLTSHRYWGEAEREEFLSNIDENVDRLSRMLENAQEMTRLEMGAVRLEQRPTEIMPLVQRVLQNPFVRKDSKRFTLNISDKLPLVEIDARRVEQALQNLLTVAAQYSPSDKKIPLSVRQQEEHILFSVTAQDRIPDEHLTHLSDRLYEDDQASSDLLKGPGLGLYVARGMVTAHGGRIWAESTTGRETTISFTLPIEAQAPAATLVRSAEKPVQIRMQPRFEPDARGPRQSLKALVVEDDPYLVRLLKINLENEGYTVISAMRGQTAIELANAEQPDIILLDVRLPDIDGFEVCARVREFNAVVPIIMITGKTVEDEIVRGLSVGADDYLIKPLSHKELLARMRSLLRRSWVSSPTPSDPVFRNGDLMIDFPQRQVVAHGKPVKLTPTEYKLLHYMAINAGRVLTHKQLLTEVWGPSCEDHTQYLWVNISRLRGKLEKDPANPEYILTEPGVGYLLNKQ